MLEPLNFTRLLKSMSLIYCRQQTAVRKCSVWHVVSGSCGYYHQVLVFRLDRPLRGAFGRLSLVLSYALARHDTLSWSMAV